MKKAALCIVAALVMSSSMSVFAMEGMSKDECMTMSMNCKNEADSIQQKMKKLNVEIKKGKKVYTAEELKTLNAKLKEANELLDGMLKPGK
jgi:hypothetical protein